MYARGAMPRVITTGTRDRTSSESPTQLATTPSGSGEAAPATSVQNLPVSTEELEARLDVEVDNRLDSLDAQAVVLGSRVDASNVRLDVLDLATGLPMIDVSKDLTGLGYPANAVPNTFGGGDAIQYAIDHLIANPTDYAGIYVPHGTWSLTKPLLLIPSSTWCQVNMFGGSLMSFPDGGATFNATLELEGGLNADELTYDAAEHAVLMIQGGIACSFWGLQFKNTGNPAAAAVPQSAIPGSRTPSDWTTPGVRTNRYSPCAAVVIDPFSDGFPAADINNAYPNLGGEYTRSTGSSNLYFHSCCFTGGYVGTVISPNGTSVNAENIVFDQCYWQGNTWSFSVGQSQSRAVELRAPRMTLAYCHLDNRMFGNAATGCAPRVTGAANFGLAYYLAHLQLDVAEFSLANAHLESIMSLGQFNPIFSGGNSNVTFDSCNFDFLAAVEGPSTEGDAAYHISGYGTFEFRNCTFSMTDGHVFKCIGLGRGNSVFRSCKFKNDGSGYAGKGILDAMFPWQVRVEDCIFNDPNQAGPIVIAGNYLGRCGEGSFFEEDITFTKVGGAGHTATFTVSSAANIEVGDILHRSNTGQGTNVEAPNVNPDASPFNYFGPVGLITDISGTTITVSGLSHTVETDEVTTYRFRVNRFDISDTEQSVLEKETLAGTATFTSAASVWVPFISKGPQLNRWFGINGAYMVALGAEANETFWVSGKNGAAFDINSSNATSTATVSWKIIPIDNIY